MQHLPAAIRNVVDRLATLPLRDPAQLRAALARFAAALDHSDAIHAFADRTLALRIANRCRALLDDPNNHFPARLRLVQIAVDYLLLDDDGESDRDSVLGFDDDALVFDACATKLGRDDLTMGGSHT